MPECRPAVLGILSALLLSGCAGSMQESAPDLTLQASTEDVRQEAALALETQRAGRARQLYQAILAESPDDVEANTGMAEALLLLGQYEAGLDHGLKAVELARDRADLQARALHAAGLCLLLTDRAGEAEEKLERAVAADPASWRTWNALGRARDAHRAWGDAATAYRRALALAPNEAAVLNNYGLSLLSAGDPDQAALLFGRALEASPDLAPAETNLRLALALQGRYEQALAGVAAEDQPAALNNAGYAALLRGDYDKARALLLQAIELSPSFYQPAWSNLQFLGSVESRRMAGEIAP
jgi:Flp pilus assembly protein TadD